MQWYYHDTLSPLFFALVLSGSHFLSEVPGLAPLQEKKSEVQQKKEEEAGRRNRRRTRINGNHKKDTKTRTTGERREQNGNRKVA